MTNSTQALSGHTARYQIPPNSICALLVWYRSLHRRHGRRYDPQFTFSISTCARIAAATWSRTKKLPARIAALPVSVNLLQMPNLVFFDNHDRVIRTSVSVRLLRWRLRMQWAPDHAHQYTVPIIVNIWATIVISIAIEIFRRGRAIIIRI